MIRGLTCFIPSEPVLKRKVRDVPLAKNFYAIRYPFTEDIELQTKKVYSESKEGVRPSVEEVEESARDQRDQAMMNVLSELTAKTDFLSPIIVQRSVGYVMVDKEMNGQCAYVESLSGRTYIVDC